ncbi:MAG: hypothetical protein OXR72_04995 [Gemmatimonadota bacterium]|nr:hypothetical protein [Gemmatimonadota bacterium]
MDDNRTVTLLNVFVASPSDVKQEREVLETVVREINPILIRRFKVQLNLLKWETAYPGFGADAQAVIDEQMSSDYQIFIGILWCRIGTPTKRANSGTIEEFEKAKARADSDPDSVQIMIYFKTTWPETPLHKMDLEQMSRVNEFREQISKSGLYCEFKSAVDFESLIRVHLQNYVQDWYSKQDRECQTSEITKKAAEEREEGLLDLADQIEGEFDKTTEVVDRISTAVDDIGKSMNIRTQEISDLSSGKQIVGRNVAKRIINRAALDMDDFVKRIEIELPSFKVHSERGVQAFLQYAYVFNDFRNDLNYVDQAELVLEQIGNLRQAMFDTEGCLVDYRATIDGMPRITTKLNQSKKSMSETIQKLIDEISTSRKILDDAVGLL